MKVLLATDGLPAAEAAEQLLARTARRDLDLGVATVGEGAAANGEGGAHDVAAGAAARLRDAGFEPAIHALEQDAGKALPELVAREHFDLVVLGAGNMSWLGRILFGNVSTQMLHSHTSVLVASRAPASPSGRISVLLATDGSVEGESAVGAAERFLAPDLCSVLLFSIVAVRVPAFAGGPVTGYASPGFDEALETPLIEERRRLLEPARDLMKRSGFSVDVRITLGAPVKRILEEARETDSDLVVVGARPRRTMDRVLVGSVSDQVARYAPAALIVRPDPDPG